MWILNEPRWGVELLLWMHQIMANPFWFEFIPKISDIFVFVYPIYLVVLYGWGIVKKFYSGNTEMAQLLHIRELKESALWVFWAGILSTFVNVFIQFWVTKDRPDIVMDLMYSKREDLILYDYLPTASFPSDHATMSMAIALATLLWGIRYKKKGYVYFSMFLFLISGLMTWARVSMGIHRPSDILGGYIVAFILVLFLWNMKVYVIFRKIFVDSVIWVEEKILDMIMGKL